MLPNRVFVRLSANYRLNSTYAVDKRQPKIDASPVRLYAAKVNTVCAFTFANPINRALRNGPTVLLQPNTSSTRLRTYRLTP